MQEILESLAANLTDFFIYLAIALVALIGVFKCVLPVRRVARRLNRGGCWKPPPGKAGPYGRTLCFWAKKCRAPGGAFWSMPSSWTPGA